AKAHGECDHAIARLIAEEAKNTVEWLVERHEVPLSCILNFQYPGHSRPHMHAAKSLDGAELHAALLAAVEREEIPLATAACATDLYADADGHIRGVRVTRPDGKTEDIGCEALILACNGYGKRFSNENAGYSEQALKVHRQPEGVAWAIFDERCDAIAMQQASHVEAKEAGAIKRCDSVEAIARIIGCDPKALAQTFADV